MGFGDLPQLDFNVDEAALQQSWAANDDGSLQHQASGLLIGRAGVSYGASAVKVEQCDIAVDDTVSLGCGYGGIVVKGLHRPSNTPLAIKIVRFEDQSKRSQLVNELRMMLTFPKGNCLVQLYAAYIHCETGDVHMALEYMNYGSLANLKHKIASVPEDILAPIVAQVLEGLMVLHSASIVHRDVKPANVLVNSQGEVKVADFGFSKELCSSQDVCSSFVGTQLYLAPERARGETYGKPADIWSLGLTVYELATGTYPYSGVKSFFELLDCVLKKPKPELDGSRFSQDLCDFVGRCLRRGPERRATTGKLQAHPYAAMQVPGLASRANLARWLEDVMAGAGPACPGAGPACSSVPSA